MDEYPEWTVDQWEQAWTIHVGRAYCCCKCGNMVMVTKGGVGVLELSCCGEPMGTCQEKDISSGPESEYHT